MPTPALAGLTGTVLVLIVIVSLLAAVPLYLSVRLLGGSPSIVTVAIAHLIATALTAIATVIFPPLGGLTGIVVPVLVYKSLFDLDWPRTILAFLLQGIVAALLLAAALLIAVVGLGITLPA